MKARIYGRFSSKPQERGDSKRRQIEGAVEYAKKNAIELVTGIDGQPAVYFDEGVSGKAGLNLEKEFGRLLKDSKTGEIILCEATDRIGRQNPFLLGSLIYDTTQRGISIITWQEGKIITPDNIEEMGTQFSVFTGAAVGHQENQRKIKRQRETWAKKRRNGADRPLTATCPSWIEAIFSVDDRGNKMTKGFKLRPQHAAIVKRIFDLSLKGMGNTAISKFFNRNSIEGIGGVPTWHPSVIDRILKNRAVLGEFQPMKTDGKGNRIPDGEPISNYYPKIEGIDEKLFNVVQFKRKQRLIMGRGRTGKVVGNLFTGICKCGFCGAAMVYTQKRSNTLVCDNARRGHKCKYIGYPYPEFEASFLNYVSELDLVNLLNPKESSTNQIADEIEQCRMVINATESKIQNLTNAVELGKGKMDILVSRIETLSSELQKQKMTLNDLLAKQAATTVSVVKVKELKQLIAKAQDRTAPYAKETRMALREAIRNLVSKIDVFPYEEIAIDPSGMNWKEKREAVKYGFTLTESAQRVERCYRIHFKNETNYRVIFSHPKYIGSRNMKLIVAEAA